MMVGVTEQTGSLAFSIPLHDHIGMKVRTLGPPAVIEVPLTDAIRGAVAPVHGGIIATIADVACAAAIGPFDYSTEIPVSTELHVRYLGQPRTSPLVAEAEIVHRGKRIIAAECVIRDADGRQVARASGTYMIVPRP
ncbi:MAG: putative thioesterase [Acidimicrobiales bacterium]|jgi:uncharacterized protein (TIGR00369 family)|nr:putative thioesterase [Acidimicrobiales bacterium]